MRLLVVMVNASPPLSAVHLHNSFPTSFRPSVAVIIAVLVTMFTLTFLLLLYAKHCKQNAMAREEAPSNHGASARARASGVDRAIVESLPFFNFSSLKGMKEGLECSVCLNTFAEPEMLRLLPKCKHAFHVECVDMWLASHSTCPLCRLKVEALDVLLPIPSSPHSTEEVEFFVQREIEAHGESSFRFNVDRIGSSRQEGKSVVIGCVDSGRKEGLVLAEAEIVDYERFVQRFAHRIIMSDVIFQHRWSDFKSSDLEFLESPRSRLAHGSDSKPYSSQGGAISKIKEEMERKRRLDKQASRLKNSGEVSTSRGRLPLRSPGRSMSEITSCERFEHGLPKREQEKWFSIARATLVGIARTQKPSPGRAVSGF